MGEGLAWINVLCVDRAGAGDLSLDKFATEGEDLYRNIYFFVFICYNGKSTKKEWL